MAKQKDSSFTSPLIASICLLMKIKNFSLLKIKTGSIKCMETLQLFHVKTSNRAAKETKMPFNHAGFLDECSSFQFLQSEGYTVRRCKYPEDLEKVFALEIDSYHPDDAATFEMIQYRLKQARNYFIVLLKIHHCGSQRNDEAEIVGFINGTCSNGSSVTHESMSTHVEGRNNKALHGNANDLFQ